jgi:hypothetical protein
VSLLAFQVTPVQVVKNGNGQLEIAVGFGAEHYGQQSFDCDGNPVTERSVQTHIVSGIVDYRSSGRLHISAFGGHTDANRAIADQRCIAHTESQVDLLEVQLGRVRATMVHERHRLLAVALEHVVRDRRIGTANGGGTVSGER